MRNGWVRMEKDNGKYDVRSSTVHVDAIYHSEHRLMVSGIQVQIQWHSPATMATMLCANRLTSDARFNLFVGEIPVHTHTHCVPKCSECSRTHIFAETRKAMTMGISSSNRTEAKDVGCNELMSIYKNCSLFIWIADKCYGVIFLQMRGGMYASFLPMPYAYHSDRINSYNVLSLPLQQQQGPLFELI